VDGTCLPRDGFWLGGVITVWIAGCVNVGSGRVPFFLCWPVEGVQFCMDSVGHLGWFRAFLDFTGV